MDPQFSNSGRRSPQKRPNTTDASPSLPPANDASRPNSGPGRAGTGKSDTLRSSASAPELAGGRKATSLQKGASLRTAAFLDRQLNHATIESRKSMAILQRQVVAEGKAADDIEFWGNRGVAGFCTFLRSKYGSIVAGWRRLDVDKNGRLSFYEFCNACRAMGYHGNLKKLWRQLDNNGNGFISLMEIDPEVGQTVGKFKHALLTKYGDMLTAWKKGLDVSGNGRIEDAEVEACVKDLGLDMSGKKLCLFLRGSPAGLGLTLMDFDPDAYQRSITGDLKGLLSAPNKEFLDDLNLNEEGSASLNMLQGGNVKGGARAYRKELALADRKEVADAVGENTRLKLGLHTVAGFKAALVNRCGSLLGAWREALDLDGNGRLTFGEFTLALSRLGFHGNVKELWKLIDIKGQGYIVFSDLDKETDDKLTELRTKLSQEHGNMLMAWLKGLDLGGTGCVEEAMFVRACEKVGFSGDGKQLFRMMQPEAGRKFLTLKDFDTKAYLALSRGDFRMISELEEKNDPRKPTEMSFDERMQSGFFFQIRRAWDVAKREEFAKATKMANAPDHFIDNNEEFEQLLRRKYGSIISAWRNCLDYDHNGKLTFNEFCNAVRFLGYGGNLNELWSNYDKDKKGHILLRDLDRQADDHVTSLLALLNERYGDLDNAWKSGFNKDPHDSIDEAELTEACAALGYPHDARKLFKCLQPSPGKQLITIWDLDPACSRKRAQGKATHGINASLPKSPTTKVGNKAHFGESGTLDEEGRAVDTSMNSSGVDGGVSMVSNASAANRRSGGPEAAAAAAASLRVARQALKKKHGSTVAAWRAHIDPGLTGQVAFGRLVLVLQDCAFHGNVKTMWEETAGTRTMINFKDIDPDAARILDEACQYMVENHGCILQAWYVAIDTEGTERVDEETFLKNMMGKVRFPKKLFKLLLARQGQRSLKVEDLEALLIPVPLTERKAKWGGVAQDNAAPAQDNAAPPADASPKSPASPGNASPSNASPKALPPDASPKSLRDHVATVSANHHSMDKICRDLESFKKILLVKHGSLFAAWRRCLDADQNGVVTQRDFATACQRLGVKAVQKIWSEFDKNKDGQISLQEIDPDTAELFCRLEQLLIDQFGSTKKGWKQVFDKQGSLRCDLDEFVEQCKSIGFEGDAEKLFKLVRPEPGRPYLAYDDLWIDVNINEFELKKAPPNNTQASPRSVRSPSPNQKGLLLER